MSVTLFPLGRNTPPDYDHVEKFPLPGLEAALRPTHVPVTLGINWYTSFDAPIKGVDGIFRLPSKNIGTIRGGHDICTEPAPQPGQPGQELDTLANYHYYNQGETEACEGFGHTRMLTLLYGKFFDPLWLYDDARRIEGAYPNGEGSTNRSTDAALVKWGAHPVAVSPGGVAVPQPWAPGNPGGAPQQIKAYRWALTAQEVLNALGITGEEITLLQSWGEGYPQRVRMPAVTLERLLREGGEAEVITEK